MPSPSRPVTVKAFVSQRLSSRWTKPLVFAAALAPMAWTVWLALTGGLGAEPVAEGVRQSGIWALRFLLLALAITPLRLLSGLSGLARFRRMIGLFAFFYALLHVLAYVGIDQFFDWQAVWRDIVKRPYITVGMGAFLILTALAATSPKSMVRRMGGRAWRGLHKGVFLAGAGACLHYVMLVKGWQPTPFVYAAILLALLGARLLNRAQRPA
ncbi:protein-methionine-sulfoxide reductase heme-binding subunit MsrQ [Azospirillum sp. SYSU D00513]|uniref:sulfite oxidase heme-binding subunit YedZ n=1 Tax=Azospirillum sp. SYSU D00513 TaxID=2812561 RepID=UPI001A963EC7|nr:protein-methionine-sulfoxide reductase heme-binding subunit MsrQ [Azospirillum sp. SYSU D00513]